MPHESDPATALRLLRERIDRLEACQRRWRRLAGGLALGVGALGLLAASSGPAASVRAREFVLVDAASQPRAVLGFREDGAPRLQLLDDHARSRARLELLKDGSPGLVLGSPKGEDLASIGASNDGSSSLTLTSGLDRDARVALRMLPDANGSLAFRNADEQDQLDLGTSEHGAAGVMVSDPQGRNRIAAEVARDGTPSLRVMGANGTVLWKAD